MSTPWAPCGGVGSGSGLLAGAAVRGGLVQGSGCATQTPRTGPRSLGPREPWSSGPVDTTQTVSLSRALKSPEAPEARSEEEVDELSLIDHSEIMARLTLKQEVGSSQAFMCRVWPRRRVGGFEKGTWWCPKQKGPSRVLTPPGGPPGRRALASRSSWPHAWATVGALRPWAHG